jgi:hypothetical protein
MFESYVYIVAGVKMRRNKATGAARLPPSRLE